ncbi:MAG: response regulator transcription factor, partial [Lachnospiraceae bacterium]|nr:response regulator transcription factor [Lachnospiraceae bacterium]
GIFKRKFAQEVITVGDVSLNVASEDLLVGGVKKNLTVKEFELLKLLMEKKGVTLKKEYLFNAVWGSDSESEAQTLTVHVKWLREKIEADPKHPTHLITVWGVGYRFE